MDEEMKDAEDAETRKDDDEATDAAKADADKKEEVNIDDKKAGLPPTSSSLSISLGFVLSYVSRISTVPPPPLIVSVRSSVQQQTTPTLTPPTTTIAPSITTTIPDPLPAIVQRVSTLEKDVKGLKQVDHSAKILASIRSQLDDQDEDHSAGPNQGKKTKRRRTKEFESLKKSSTFKVPNTNTAPRNNWFKQPLRPPTHDPEWNNVQAVDDSQEKTWFNDLLSTKKAPHTFDEIMATPIDLSNFIMNRLKIDKLTKAHLVGLVYNLLNGTCQSSIELEYNMEECYKALFSKHDVYSSLKILSVVSVIVNKLHGYGYLEEIMVRRVDQQLYKFKEGDFANLHLNDIEDMLLFFVQHKLFNLDGEVIIDLVVALRMFTRSLIIKRRVKDVQLAVESYQKKLNITKPQKDFPGISAKELYTPSFDLPEVLYEDLSHGKRLMRADELYKFLDGMLKKFCDTLHHRLLNFRFSYNKDMPRRKWSTMDKKRACIMVDLIYKLMLERWIIRNQERLVGAMELEMDYMLMQRTI
ncbi:hypothetical protein Tco_0716912 [Tanacetum coccineum]